MGHASVVTLRLRRGRAKPLHAGHPWVFADALAPDADPAPQPGDEVRIADAQGQILGHGYYSPTSAIAVRLLTRGDQPVTDELLASRLDQALRLRAEVLCLGDAAAGAVQAPQPAPQPRPGAVGPTTAYRLVHSEGDGLGGLIVDVYGPWLCLQLGTVGMFRRREAILDLLEQRLRPRGILDRSDAHMRRLEGLPAPQVGPLRGEPPEAPVEVLEEGIPLLADPRPGHGQKTGLYLDQRENRAAFASYASGREVLDVFSYTGAFSLHAARAGARSLTLIESGAGALEAARRNLERNAIGDADLVCADWKDGFRHLREAGRLFDLAVLDPPRFSRGRQTMDSALAGYHELNQQAARLMRAGGILFTCCCSGSVPETDFERAVAWALHQAGRRATLLDRRGAARDHPIPPGFEQGRYLKCLVLKLD